MKVKLLTHIFPWSSLNIYQPQLPRTTKGAVKLILPKGAVSLTGFYRFLKYVQFPVFTYLIIGTRKKNADWVYIFM